MDQFLEMLRAAQGGHGIEALAQAYGLSVQQAQAAAEAMLPALTDGFRHASQSPETMASLMSLMMSGPYAALYAQPAAPTELSKAGSDALDAVFGSNEVSRAVANHVAASTGLGIALVRQMMPGYATFVVGGLARSLAASGALQQMLGAMLGRMAGAPARPTLPATGNPWIDAFMAFSGMGVTPRVLSTGNPWADAFAQAMVRHSPAAMAQRPGTNAWQDLVNAMTNTMTQAGIPTGLPPAMTSGARPAPPAQPLPFQNYFAQMFAQGFPPLFPGVGTGEAGARYGFPDYWLEMVTPPPAKEPEGSKSVAKPAPKPAPPPQIKGPNGKAEG